MARLVTIGDLRVQQIERKDGRRSWTIVWLEGTVHTEAVRFRSNLRFQDRRIADFEARLADPLC
ncbi:hypothetical protein AB0D34_04215 [Streptomyces sp. NPDC048420]|uniref:hypothetical protein n=1 Tax=Streptomyces sp. NPDC048420 TaxID=3155755 RepID=UPI003445625F